MTHRPSSGAQTCNCCLWFYIRFWLLVAAMAQPSQQHLVGSFYEIYIKVCVMFSLQQSLLLCLLSDLTKFHSNVCEVMKIRLECYYIQRMSVL